VASSSSTSQQQLLCLSSASVAELLLLLLLLLLLGKQQKNTLPSRLGAKKVSNHLTHIVIVSCHLRVPCGRQKSSACGMACSPEHMRPIGEICKLPNMAASVAR
jgi:hypothetical protein